MRWVHPRITKIRQVNKSVMIVIPETGFDVLPQMPTVSDVIATKKKLKTVRMTMVRKFIGKPGKSHKNAMINTEPRMSHFNEISRSVRSAEAFSEAMRGPMMKPTPSTAGVQSMENSAF